MTLHVITKSKRNAEMTSLLEVASTQRSIPFNPINPEAFNSFDTSYINEGDLLYRISIQSDACQAEQLIMHQHDVTTLYATPLPELSNFKKSVQVLQLQHAGVSVPTTAFAVPHKTAALQETVDQLGGWPVVLKAEHGSHGVGVIKVDSIGGLTSLLDHVREKGTSFVLQQFITAPSSARFVVLGEQVIDSYEYRAAGDEFRSNVGADPDVKLKEYDKELETAAVAAVKALGLEFGGVDMLLGSNGEHYVLEVNFPCNFGRSQELTGTDIAGMMVDYLVEKSERSKSGSGAA